ncbi:MAG: acetoacetate decarboxylase family protein [Marmoricola sp.]
MSTGHMPLPVGVDTSYPPAPWQMHGQLWLSLFRVREGDHPDRAPGVYGVALVKYEDPSPLTYGELLVAHLVDPGSTGSRAAKAVHITDIWVDSPASVAGGRALWAIPKDLCDFTFSSGRRGPTTHTSWSAGVDGQPIVSAGFTDLSRFAPRLPFKGNTWQQRESGEAVTACLTGSSRALPCRASWTFDPSGPLGWLDGKRTLASFRQADFSMSFG